MSYAAFLAGVGTILMALVRGFRSEAVQSLIPEQYRWRHWTPLAKLGFVFLLSLAGALATAVSQGTPVGQAFSAALTAALVAMGANASTKEVGSALTANAVAKDPDYQPSALRDVLSIALPVDKSILEKPHAPPNP